MSRTSTAACSIDLWRQWITRYGDSPKVNHQLGQSLAYNEQADEAREVFQRAISLAPQDADLQLALGTLEAGQERTDAAQKAFQQVAQLRPERSICGWKHLSICPTVFPDTASIDNYWSELQQRLDTALVAQPTMNWKSLPQDGFTLSFNLPHLGRCCRGMKEKFSKLFAGAFPQHRPDPRPGLGSRPVRVGFLVTAGHESGFLRGTAGVLQRLDPARVEPEQMSPACCGGNTAPYVIPTHGTDCTLAEVFLDYHDNAQEFDSTAIVDLSSYFADYQQSSSSLAYSVQSNSTPASVGASISGNNLTLTSTSIPGISTVVVRATDSGSLYSEWPIHVYSVQVIGYEVQERGWGGTSYTLPQDSDDDWSVLWTADSHRWLPVVAPPAAAQRIVNVAWADPDGYFANSQWCGPPENYPLRDPWSYGSPTHLGDLPIMPRVTFSAIDPLARLKRDAHAELIGNPESSDAPQLSLHKIESLKWIPVESARTIEVPEHSQDVYLADLSPPDTERPYWAVHPSAMTPKIYDTVRVKATIEPPIPAGMVADIHLAWYDPINTVANVPTTPPTSTVADMPRDNDAVLDPLFGATLEFSGNEDEVIAYYKIEDQRFGDNFIVAAHPREHHQKGYYFGTNCVGEEVLRMRDYPADCMAQWLNPGRPDFSEPMEDTLLSVSYQTPKLHHIPAIDIDTNSDNDAVFSQSEEEDMVEDGEYKIGHRIFLNNDDDNKNGVADLHDDASKYTYHISEIFNDNDFAEIKIKFDGDIPDGYQLWLGYEHAGLKLYADTKKADLNGDDTHAWGSDKWIIWNSGEEGEPRPDTIYAEGISLGSYKVYWRLVKAGTGGTEILNRDTIKINVEKIVWPNQATNSPTDLSQNTDTWDGVAVHAGGYIEKSLNEIINEDFGYIRTQYPAKQGTTGDVWKGERNINSTLDLTKLAGIGEEWDGSTIRIEVSYEFEQSPNIKDGNYVDTTNSHQGAGFFANSGIKIENRAEIQIFDTDSLLSAIAGSTEIVDSASAFVRGNVTDINSTGYVDLWHTTDEEEEEPIPAERWWNYSEPPPANPRDISSTLVGNLITGRPYKVDLELDTEDPLDTYFKRLQDAPKGAQTMVIDVSRGMTPGGPFAFTVAVDGSSEFYDDVQIADKETHDNLIYFQSRWGSGVKHTSFKVTKL